MDYATERRKLLDWDDDEIPSATAQVFRTPLESTEDNSLPWKSPMKIRERFRRLLKGSGCGKENEQDERRAGKDDPERPQEFLNSLMLTRILLKSDDDEPQDVVHSQEELYSKIMNNTRKNHFQEDFLKLIDKSMYLEEIVVVPASKRDIFTDPYGLRKARQQLLEERSQEPVDYELDEVWVSCYEDREFNLTTKSQVLLMIMSTKDMFSHTDGGINIRLSKKHLTEPDYGEVLPSIRIRVPVKRAYTMWKFMVRFLCDDQSFDYSFKNDYLSKLSVGGLWMKPFDNEYFDLTLWFVILPIKRWENHYGRIVTSTVALILHRAWEGDTHLEHLSGSIKCLNETTHGRYVSWLDLAMQN